MDQRIWIYTVLVFVGIMGAAGDIAVNFWAKSHRFEWWVVSCLIWIGVATLFGVVLRWEHFAFGVAVILALLIHSICAVLFDWLWYKTNLTFAQWAGILMAIIAIGFIEGGKKTGEATALHQSMDK